MIARKNIKLSKQKYNDRYLTSNINSFIVGYSL